MLGLLGSWLFLVGPRSVWQLCAPAAQIQPWLQGTTQTPRTNGEVQLMLGLNWGKSF